MTGPAPVGEWADPEGEQPAAQLEYPTLDRWVCEWFAPTFARKLTQTRIWCPDWWRHAEAIVCLEAMWRSWEHLRLDAALGMSVWLHQHGYRGLDVLLDLDGPFTGCNHTDGHKPRAVPLPAGIPPAGLFG